MPSVDLSKLSPEELKQISLQAQKELESRKKAELARLVELVRKTAEEAGLDVEEVRQALSAKVDRRKGKLEPKYRDPKSGKEWSGRGRKPSWLPADKKRWGKFLVSAPKS